MVLYYYGKWVTQADIWDKGGIHSVVIGTFPSELKRALNGLGVPAYYFDKTTRNYDPHADLRRKIRQDRPPMILVRMGAEAYHWVVVVGYNNQNRYLIAVEPDGFFEWWDKAYLDLRWRFGAVMLRVAGSCPSV